ncbi:MAG TPA: hypothetical protein EYN06_07400, partial [Myxococcales bacterium]|nr:hypothetical protein [Myxococcales bacterium]
MKVSSGLISLILVVALACSAPESDSVDNGALPGVSDAGGSTDSSGESDSTGTTDESDSTGTTDESGSAGTTDSMDTAGSTGVTDGNAAGTTDDNATGTTDDGTTGTTDDGGTGTQPVALLEIYALDIWAQTLPAESTAMTVKVDGVALASQALPKTSILLTDAETYHITIESADHVTASVHVSFDGSGDVNATKLLLSNDSGLPGLSLGHFAGDDEKLQVHTLYVGLQHHWFSSQGAPARRGNQIQLLMNGEDAWSQVYKDIKLATKSALVSTWWWDSEFELVRDYSTHHTLTSVERWKNTMMGVLESSPLHIRLLVGEFWGTHDIVDWLSTDDAAAYYANQINDEFEVMGQGNATADVFLFEPEVFAFGQRVLQAYPDASAQSFDNEMAVDSPMPSKLVDLTIGPLSVGPQLASWHQKFMVLDGKVAFVGGMNIKAVDWDTSKHRIFEHRRMAFDAIEEDRLAVLSKTEEPDFGPRKDYIMRVEGPSTQDVAATFQTRWSQLMDEGASYSEKSSKFSVDTAIAAKEDGLQVQVTTTMPKPNASQSIGETWLKAVEQAQDYILIEDQYWRVPLVAEAILDRMEVAPNLRLVVITK